VAIATPDGRLRSAVGHCEGEIIPEERGDNGFGYDPIFLVGSEGHTMAELDMAAKNRVSHRANAIQNAMPLLQSLLQDGTVAAG
jgi:XTP/dITP diphosphohydrolase